MKKLIIVLLLSGCNLASKNPSEYHQTTILGVGTSCCLEQYGGWYSKKLVCTNGVTVHRAANYIVGEVCK